MRESGTLPLRSVPLAASLSIIPFCESLDPRAVPLTLLFYLFPYCFTVFWLRPWRSLATGFAVGLSASMAIAVIGTLLKSLGFLGRIPSKNSYAFAESLNVLLTVLAIATWVWDRKRINHLTAGFMVGSHRRYG